MSRIRVRFAKLGKVRWTSHRDVARMWERAFRRVQLPVAYSEGFSPRPRLSFGLALPTGCESVAEYLDVEVAGDGVDVDVRLLPDRLSAALPAGVDAVAAAVLPPGSPSLQEVVDSCTWRWSAVAAEGGLPPGEDDLAARAAALLAAPTAVVTRARKGVETTDDIRPGILDLRVLGSVACPESRDSGESGGDPSPAVWVEAELASKPRSLRPAEVMAALSPGLEERDVRRTHQWILRDGARREPLTVGAPDVATAAPHAWERAS